MDSEDDGYDVVVVGSSNTTQDGNDAVASYLGTGLEICLDDTLELTSNCPSGYGFILSFTMEVSSISDLTITFTTTAGPVVEEVLPFCQLSSVILLLCVYSPCYLWFSLTTIIQQ